VRLEGESDTYCTNIECPAQRVQRIAHYASRSAMDIEGLGEERVVVLIAAGLIADPADLYEVTVDAIAEKQAKGFAALSASNLVQGIAASKRQPLSRLLVALGIRHVGPVAARAVARRFGTMDAIREADESELAAVEGVGPVIAASLAEFLAAPANQVVIERLREAGVATTEPGATGDAGGGAEAPGVAQTLVGKTVVVTGAVPGYTREGAEEAIMARGGKSPGSVSKKTFALVVGDAPGASKLKKAEELDIPIVPAEGFVALLETGALPG
jgi:DNA ligase (NAD+)